MIGGDNGRFLQKMAVVFALAGIVITLISMVITLVPLSESRAKIVLGSSEYRGIERTEYLKEINDAIGAAWFSGFVSIALCVVGGFVMYVIGEIAVKVDYLCGRMVVLENKEIKEEEKAAENVEEKMVPHNYDSGRVPAWKRVQMEKENKD